MRHRPDSAPRAAGLERFSGPFARPAASCATGAGAGRAGKAAGAVRRRWDGPDGAGWSRGPRHGDARRFGGDTMRDFGLRRAGAADPAAGMSEARRGRDQGVELGRDHGMLRQASQSQREDAGDLAVGPGEVCRGWGRGVRAGRECVRLRRAGWVRRGGAGGLLRGLGGAGRDLGSFGRGVRVGGRARGDGVRSSGSGLVGGRAVGLPRCDGAWAPLGRPGGLKLDRGTAQRHNPALRPVVAEQPWGAAP